MNMLEMRALPSLEHDAHALKLAVNILQSNDLTVVMISALLD